jgi:hypothetical protein
VGLHLNLTEPFDDPGAPPELRARHLDLARRYGGPSFIFRSRRWTFDPPLRKPTDLKMRNALSGGELGTVCTFPALALIHI